MNLKQTLFQLCAEFVNTRLQTIQNTITSNQKSLQTETKSSAGDKHETGRAMLQLEMEKAGQQLSGVLQMSQLLPKILLSKTSEVIHLGSIVITNKNNYYISVSAGKLVVSNTVYFAISTHSPIGKLLLGKKVNDVISWNDNEMIIERIL